MKKLIALQTTSGYINNQLMVLSGDLYNASGTIIAYVDNAVASLELSEFFSNVVYSGAYYIMSDAECASGTILSSALSAGSDQLIYYFITPSGQPHLDRLLKGTYDCHTHLSVTSTLTKTTYVYYQIYKRTGEVETLLATSAISGPLTTTKTFYDMYSTISSEVAMLDTDRLVIKWYANVTGGGSSIQTQFFVGGQDDSHFSIKVESIELNRLYLPYSGGVMDVTSNYNINTTKNLGVSGNLYSAGTSELHDTTFINPTGTNVITINANEDNRITWNHYGKGLSFAAGAGSLSNIYIAGDIGVTGCIQVDKGIIQNNTSTGSRISTWAHDGGGPYIKVPAGDEFTVRDSDGNSEFSVGDGEAKSIANLHCSDDVGASGCLITNEALYIPFISAAPNAPPSGYISLYTLHVGGGSYQLRMKTSAGIEKVVNFS